MNLARIIVLLGVGLFEDTSIISLLNEYDGFATIQYNIHACNITCTYNKWTSTLTAVREIAKNALPFCFKRTTQLHAFQIGN